MRDRVKLSCCVLAAFASPQKLTFHTDLYSAIEKPNNARLFLTVTRQSLFGVAQFVCLLKHPVSPGTSKPARDGHFKTDRGVND